MISFVLSFSYPLLWHVLTHVTCLFALRAEEPWGKECIDGDLDCADESCQSLRSCEDRLRGQQALLDAASMADHDDTIDTESGNSKQIVPGDLSQHKCAKSCFDVLRGLTKYGHELRTDSLKAFGKISQPMEDFIVYAQKASGILSGAQICREVCSSNRHNLIEHQLSLARQRAQMAGGKRTSRFCAWQEATSKASQLLESGSGMSPYVFQRLTHEQIHTNSH